MTFELSLLYLLYLVAERFIQLDTRRGGRKFAWLGGFITGILLPAVIFRLQLAIAVYVLLLILRVAAALVFKNKKPLVTGIAVPALLVTVSFLFTSTPLHVRLPVQDLWASLAAFSFLFQAIVRHADIVLTTALGVLLVGFESNNAVRGILRRYHLLDPAGQSEGQKSAAAVKVQRGSAIGILERILMFMLILFGKPEAITLIVAAKAVYRYKSLEDKDFAEYVLIGTLLSITITFAVSYVVISFRRA